MPGYSPLIAAIILVGAAVAPMNVGYVRIHEGVSAAPASSPGDWSGIGKIDNQGVHVDAELATRGGKAFETGGADGAPAAERYFRSTQKLCEVFDGLDDPTSDLSQGCADFQRLIEGEQLECEADSFYLGALYRQTREIGPDGTPGAWSATGEPVADQSCVTPADLAGEAERAFATLALGPSPIVVQPPDGWTLVNVPTITYTQPTEQTLDTTLLGIPVQIRAAPRSFTWDYGDGTTPLTTTDPGAAYPHHTVAHTYDQPADQVQIALTTTWSGQFRITGTPTWTDVTGTATTTSTAAPLRVYEARSRLVTDNLPD
ncbi:hypothetical protein [Cellulosimicrobium cellulans]|uniref:hypothetical protein n=1 Tax=Cellulosimicrobium cellulans TaxID=1710 RepID=UPI002404EC03|nr:hypothetical protein [Cellulosimicrobium cellulans]MDF9877227.1 hypothetical protein [Cellulosimicrobium cellulans]